MNRSASAWFILQLHPQLADDAITHRHRARCCCTLPCMQVRRDCACGRAQRSFMSLRSCTLRLPTQEAEGVTLNMLPVQEGQMKSLPMHMLTQLSMHVGLLMVRTRKKPH